MRRFRIPEGTEIQPADPAARARALIIVAVLVSALVGLFLISALFGDPLEESLREYVLELAERPEYLFLAAFMVMLPMAGISIYVYRQGAKVVRAERVPIPGQKVITDTPIITGKQAVRQGRVLQGLGVFMGVSSLVLPFLLAILVMLIQQEV